MRFRPCIDLHDGVVKQIVGATLRDGGAAPQTNFAARLPPAYYAGRYGRDGLDGGHVIMLGPGNEAAAAEALAAYPGGLQVGGGVRPDNAVAWLQRGAAAVIVTSYVFREGRLDRGRLEEMAASAGRERLVLDLSCARDGERYVVATDRWQRLTDVRIDRASLELLSGFCCEFLVHATEVEGRQAGIDENLVALLGDLAPRPTTYAGGVRSMQDVERLAELGQGRLDFTVGSALDLFGGRGVRYADLVEWDRRQR
ncbi:MAG: phosphoribosylformimino-5-aminoimidazole carboxamide ribotide isomerase [Gemmatimonadota bacterium]